MPLLALAYPDLKQSDFELIQQHRKAHDSIFYDVVDPHFSFVFAVSDLTEDSFIEEVTQKAKEQKHIHFVIRCATISKDGFEDSYHVFLVPDEGHSEIIRLHDVLYSGLLKSNLRLDLDYIPHLAIGNSTDPNVSKKLAEEWNNRNITIQGTISKLSIIRYEDNLVTMLKDIELV